MSSVYWHACSLCCDCLLSVTAAKSCKPKLFPGSVHDRVRVQDTVAFQISGASFYCVGPLFKLLLAFLPYLLFDLFSISRKLDIRFSPVVF